MFPAQVATRAATYATGNEAAKFKVDFTIIDEPSLNAPVPQAIAPLALPKPVEDCDDDHNHGGHEHGDYEHGGHEHSRRDEQTDVTVLRSIVHEHVED